MLDRIKTYRRPLVISGGCLAAYALAGFVIVPALISRQAPQLIADAIGQKPQLQGFRFNPFSFQAEIRGFSLPGADGKQIIEFSRLVVDLDAIQSLARQGLVLSSLTLETPQADIQRRADGSFNFNDLLPKSAPQQEARQTQEPAQPLILIRQLGISGGQFSWSDASQGNPVQETRIPFELNVADFSTRANGDADFSLGLELETGGHLNWQGSFSLAELRSNGRIELDNLDLNKVWQLFLQPLLPLAINDGHLSLHGDYQFGYHDKLELQFQQGNLELQQLQLADKKQPADSLISIPNLSLQGIAVDLGKQSINLATINSSNANIRAWLDREGRINFQSLFADDSKPAPSQPQPADGQPWRLHLGELALNGYQIHFSDRQHTKPLDMSLSELNIKLQNFNGLGAGKFPMQLSAKLNQTSKLNLSGDLNPDPFAGEWNIELEDLKLKTFQPYLDQAINLELVDGELSSKGHLTLNTAQDLQLTYQGDANIDSLVTRDTTKNRDFVKWANLELQQMAIDVGKQEYRFGKIFFDKPYARFTIKKDGKTNIDDILGKAENDSKPAPPVKPKLQQSGPEPLISIASIEFADGKSDFADYSLILPFVAEMNKLNGEIDGFASNTDQAAKLKLKGKVYDLATVNINGDYQFQSNDSKIALNFSHMPLPLVTPYMAEFAGYKIEKGQMALDLQYVIKRGQLQANNKVLIDQLKLGEKIDNPKAVSLPLELAIALLKDADGKINLDFPISGSLEDPQFSIGAMVGDVLVNLVKKVALSPFKAIAGLVTDSEVDLSSILFEAGSNALSLAEIDKLGHVSEALAQKPQLTLEIKGRAVLARDWPTLSAAVVTEVLKKMKSGELRDKGEKIRAEYIELSDDDYKRLLAKFYAEVFPGEIDYGLLGKPRMRHNPDVDFYKIARLQLEAIMQPEEQRLTSLAIARANSIASYLSEKAGVDRDRIFFLASETQTGTREDQINALLSLNVAQ